MWGFGFSWNRDAQGRQGRCEVHLISMGDPDSGFRFGHGLLEHSDFKAPAARYRA